MMNSGCDTLSSLTPGIPSGTVSSMAVDVEFKRREVRLRETAKRRGLLLSKSRRRDPRALDYGYQLTDSETGKLIVGNPRRGYGATLDQVEKFLDQPFSND